MCVVVSSTAEALCWVVSSSLWGWAAGTGSIRQLGIVGTLLGPEGSDESLMSSIGPTLVANRRLCAGRRGGVGWVRPYLENCTVDASIFVAKL